MKLSCELEVTYRLAQERGEGGKSKRAHCLLSIGKKGEGIQLIVSTLKNVTGSSYKLNDNIIQIFAKFLKEGKATIRIKEPAHDLCISKADPIKLKQFLLLLKQPTTEQLTGPTKLKDLDKPPTKLTIKTRSDYPLKGFPSSLETIVANGIRLHRIDRRIFQLKCLKFLDLSCNNIKCIPDEINVLPLVELYLSGNQITELPCCDGSQLIETLKVLDLSRNSLTTLPQSFIKLRSLVQLKLDCNKLQVLPRGLGKHQTSLRFFSASCNQLVVLPYSFINLKLDSLDLFGNPFQATGLIKRSQRLSLPELTELSARAVKRYKLPYSPQTIPVTLCHYLDSFKRCLCGTLCFTAYLHYIAKLDLHKVSSTITAVDQNGLTSLPIELFLCSAKCLKLWK